MGVLIKDIADELGYASKEIIEKAQEMGFKKVKTASNKVSEEEAAAIYDYIQTGILPGKKSKPAKKSSEKAQEDENRPAKKQSETKKTAKKESPKKAESLKTSESKESAQSAKEPSDEKTRTQEPEVKTEKSQNQKEEISSTPQEKEEKQNAASKPAPVQINSGDSIASESLQKRRGLVIVKKKKEVQVPAAQDRTEPRREKISASLEAIFSNAELNLKKKKIEKKKAPAAKKENALKIDIIPDHEMADIVIEDEDVVVMPDFTVKPIQTENRTKSKNQPNIYHASQNQIFSSEGGISRGGRKKHKKAPREQGSEIVSSVNIPKEIRVYEFADKIKKQPSEIIGKLFALGMMTTKNDFLDEDAIEILASEFGIEVNIIDEAQEFDYIKAYEDSEGEENLIARAPVITIMGHVDHGKTSLLDYIRNSRVASGEAGGITQHIGAYMVEKNGKKITFIDTPGHEAFTSMRARGAEVTDIVIIVVAADDGVKPQTKEAIAHAKAANVPIIIAINKMDKPNANPDLVKTGLAELDIMPTEWGGSYEFVPISAKTGEGIENLLEIVLLQADLLELKADPSKQAKATIIESSLQKGRGAVATVIVQNGTLRVGDTVVAGIAYGKVRALSDDKGRALKQILPGECGVIIGLSEVPGAGETLIGVSSDKEAREYASKIYEHQRQKELSKSTKVTIDELSAKIAEGSLKSLPVIVKADVAGSLEAIKASLEKLRNDEVKVDIIHSGIGGITQNDIALASASENCVILGFNVRPTGEIKELAKERGAQIKTYNVIYNLIDDIKALLGGLMSPIISEEALGQAEIRQVINVPKIGQIAGCMVTDGLIARGAKIRVIREGVIVFEGNVSSLKRFKDDAKEVAKGFECGVGIEGYDDMRVGDFIESYKQKEEQATID